MADHGASETGTLHGNHLLKAGTGAAIWRPSWGGLTTVRILPQPSPDNPAVWDPYRLSMDTNGFGDWVRRYPAVRNMGTPPVSFISHDPADPSVDPQTSPAWLLFRAIDRAVAQGQDQQGWAMLLRGGQNRGPALPKPKEVYLLQCVLMEHKSKIMNPPKGSADDDPTIILELGPSAGQTLLALCNEPNPQWTGDPMDWNGSMKYGDLVDLHTGRFVTFFKLGENPLELRRRGAGAPPPAGGPQRTLGDTFGARRSAGGGDGQESDEIGFGVLIENDYSGIAPAFQAVEDKVRRKVKVWDDILRFPTYEEQAHLLADKFPTDVIFYAWRDAPPEWIPEQVRRRHVGAVSGAVPSAGPGYVPPTTPAAPFGGNRAPQAAFGGPQQVQQPQQPQYPAGQPTQGYPPTQAPVAAAAPRPVAPFGAPGVPFGTTAPGTQVGAPGAQVGAPPVATGTAAGQPFVTPPWTSGNQPVAQPVQHAAGPAPDVAAPTGGIPDSAPPAPQVPPGYDPPPTTARRSSRTVSALQAARAAANPQPQQQ